MSNDAIVILRDDHKQVRALFREFEKPSTTKSRKGTIVKKVIELLTVHTYIENEVMYPEVRRLLPDLEDDVLESYEEHHVADVLVMELAALKPGDERFEAKTTVLIENVRHHMDEEEQDWFPKVRDGLSRTQLRELGEQLLAAKERAPQVPRPAERPQEGRRRGRVLTVAPARFPRSRSCRSCSTTLLTPRMPPAVPGRSSPVSRRWCCTPTTRASGHARCSTATARTSWCSRSWPRPPAREPSCEALTSFGQETDRSAGFASLVAVFRATDVVDESEFETLLWRQLELLHEADGRPWDPRVSDDPANPHFAFSVGGTAFFVVGLHPESSRIARRTPLPTLVFNLHEQFEELRGSDRFDRMRDTIRRRDGALQGSLNPMVADHGRSSEARQYSGRAVPADWEAPVRFDAASDTSTAFDAASDRGTAFDDDAALDDADREEESA